MCEIKNDNDRTSNFQEKKINNMILQESISQRFYYFLTFNILLWYIWHTLKSFYIIQNVFRKLFTFFLRIKKNFDILIIFKCTPVSLN